MENNSFTNEINELVKKHDRKVIECVLFRILTKLYFQNYNKQCNYDKMTGADVVNAQHKVLEEIEKEFDYKLEDDFYPLPF